MNRKKVVPVVSMVLFAMFVVLLMGSTSASEVRTLILVPVADSFVSYSTPQANFGKELYLRTEYAKQETVLGATSFTVPPSSVFFNVYLPQNGRITGSFEVTAGGNKDINFAITDSVQSASYYQLNRVTVSDFSFVAPYTGDFRLVFDNSFSWFTSKTVSLSDVILTMDSNVISAPIFLLFDLSNIPPEATINTANLSLTFKDSGVSLYNIVKSFDCSESNWNEQAITFENAPLSQSFLTESSSLNMSVGISVGSRIYLDIRPDVVRSMPNGKVTEVVAVVDGEFPAGFVEFYSRESENTPRLEISYTYVSASSSLSSSFMIEGQNVAVNVTTNPSQPQGNIRIQYSTDQVKWYDMSQFQGGSAYYVWTPSMTGQVFVRSVWEVSWNGGSYQTLSSVSGIYIMPILLVVAIPVAIIAVIVAVVGIRYWRKRRVQVKKNSDFQAPQAPAANETEKT
jgi:hypothetical protein